MPLLAEHSTFYSPYVKLETMKIAKTLIWKLKSRHLLSQPGS